MEQRALWVVAFASCVACGSSTIEDAGLPRDGGTASDAGVSRDAGVLRDGGVSSRDAGISRDGGETRDGGTPLPALCRLDDDDVPAPFPTAIEVPCPADSPSVLFTADPQGLAPEVEALHALCGTMNPAPSTDDYTTTATLAAAVDAFLLTVIDRPPLARLLDPVGSSTTARMDALRTVWFANNAFEHVLCGELNDTGRVGGLHLWSELYFAEQEGRANYFCTVEGAADPNVVTARYEWVPQNRTTAALKPIGSVHVGMSPACLLAVGYYAVTSSITPSMGSQPSFMADIYGTPTPFVLRMRDGAMTSLYPLAGPR